MDISHGTRDGEPVILLQVPSGGPPVTFDTAGWDLLIAAGVTSVVAQKGPSGESIVARMGKPQTAAARIVWGDDPPPRIVFANGDRRDLRRANLLPWSAAPKAATTPPKQEPLEPPGWSSLTAEERRARIGTMVREDYRRMWHAERALQIRNGCYPLAHLIFPKRRR